MTEQSFTTELLKWAKTYGWRAFHVRNSGYGGNTFVQGDPGFPDLVLLKPPRLIFAELKLEKKKPTANQLAWLGELDRLRHWIVDPGRPAIPFEQPCVISVHVWTPVDFPTILKVLGETR